METLACLNGRFLPADEATVPIWDRGFLFGDSVYEVLRLYAGRCFIEADHRERLARSLREMRFAGVDLDALWSRMHATIGRSGVAEATVYIQVTRGVAPRKHAFPGPGVPPTELIVVKPYDDAETARHRQVGVPVVTYEDIRWRRCDVKSTNLLANVLANEAAHEAGGYEAILVGPGDEVSEATHSSLLWARGGRLEATPEGPGILPGTTRREVVRIAEAAGIPFDEATITLQELGSVDELILTGTTVEVMPVAAVDGRPVGDGRPGPITRRLQSGFRASISRLIE